MTHPNARKGRDAEIRVARYLAEHGFPHAEPTRRSGWADDRGDIDGTPGIAWEVKAEKRIDLPGYLAELEAEIANAGASTGAVVVKRRGTTDPGEWYAVMPLRRLAPLLKEAGW